MKNKKKISTRNKWLIGIACTIIFIIGFVGIYENFDMITNYFKDEENIDNSNDKSTTKDNEKDYSDYFDFSKKSDDYFVGNYIEYFYIDYPVTCDKFRKNEVVYQITLNKDHTAKIYTGSCMGENEIDLLWENEDGVNLYYKDKTLFAEFGYGHGEGKTIDLVNNNIYFARTSTKYMKNEKILVANDISIDDIYSWNDYGGYNYIELDSNLFFELKINLKQKVKEYDNLYFYIKDSEENYMELNGKKIYSLDYGIAEKFDVLDNYFVILEMGYVNDIGPDIGIGGYNIELFNNNGEKVYDLYDVLLKNKLVTNDFAGITFIDKDNVLADKKIKFEIATEDYIEYVNEKAGISPDLNKFEKKKMYDIYEIEFVDGIFNEPQLISTVYNEDLPNE